MQNLLVIRNTGAVSGYVTNHRNNGICAFWNSNFMNGLLITS